MAVLEVPPSGSPGMCGGCDAGAEQGCKSKALPLIDAIPAIKGPRGVLSSLYDSLNRERKLSEENERFKKEENSVDHAYATLLVNGQVKKTPFRRAKFWRSKNEDMDMIVEVFSGPGKAAAVIHLTNTYYGGPWKLDGAYLTRDFTSYTARPFALRMDRPVIVPGQSGKIAVVVDKSAFETEGGQLADLALQIFRGDGLLQVAVAMDHTLIRQ